jgi:ankyrin repeat protein
MLAKSSFRVSAIILVLILAGAGLHVPTFAATPATQPAQRDLNLSLWNACRVGTARQVRALIEAGADVNVSLLPNCMTLLMRTASRNPHPQVIELLIAAGTKVNGRDVNGVNALMRAVERNPNPQVTAALLKAGADVKARDRWGSTVLMHAVAFEPNAQVIEMLLKAGVDVNARPRAAIQL